MLFTPLGKIAGHGIAHRAESNKAYLDCVVARSTWTGERVVLGVLDVEEVGILWSVHSASSVGGDDRGEDKDRDGGGSWGSQPASSINRVSPQDADLSHAS